MDKDTRNRIQRATQDARRLLEQEFGEQLEGTFDLRLDGTIASAPGDHLEARQRRIRERLVEAVAHRRAMGERAADAVDGFRREAAFTMLNRFVALKMLEARGLVQPCVSEGQKSAGFREFGGLAPGLVELEDHGYRLFIESLFDEIGREVRVLFDRREPASLLWPRRPALDGLLGILNAPDLAGVWREDETIGWVYQYFNGEDERRQMRSESQAPRNSRELAVRNQFFTPRYVVEFLTDNTLGRTWYEMRGGETGLRERCRYLVWRPNEVWLGPGEEPPVEDGAEGAAEEDLNHKPVHVRHRAKKDPRDLRVLDPACGSGHFLLYAFDQLLVMYEEAWADEASPEAEVTGRSLRQDYPTIDGLRRAMPGLLLRHNLWGIDIDPRAAQIAALALWMRAQRAFNEFDVPRGTRDAIARANVVVAEPMPGERELLREFCAGLDGNVASLVEAVFEEMKLAGEAGSLLRIEESVDNAIRRLAPSWGGMYSGQDERRWSQAEAAVLEALREYAEGAINGKGFRRRMFSDDAAQGLAFIDACRQTYDVVLMNPPFGDAAKPALDRLDSLLSSCGRDIGAAFVRDGALRFAPGGKVGVLLSTAPWFKPVFENWREALFFGEACQLDLSAQFGGEVLDGATVNASPMVLGGASSEVAEVFRLTRNEDLEAGLRHCVDVVRSGAKSPEVFRVLPAEACVLPGRPFSYWVSRPLRRRIARLPPFEGNGGTVKQGTATADEFRFARAWWEVLPDDARWMPYTKTSPYSPFWDDITWVGKFGHGLREIDSTGRARVQGTDFFEQSGVTYTSKSVLGFNPRLQPAGCGFGHSGSVVFGADAEALSLLGFLASAPVEYLLSLFVGELQGKAGVHPNHYEVGTIQRLPWPGITPHASGTLRQAAHRAVSALRALDELDEVARAFRSAILEGSSSLGECAEAMMQLERDSIRAVCDARAAADRVVAGLYGFTVADLKEMEAAFEDRIPPASGKWRIYFGADGQDLDESQCVQRVISWSVGVAMTRWLPATHAVGRASNGTDDLTGEPSRLSPAVARDTDGGILVDDPGHHADVLARMRDVFAGIWGDRVDHVLREAADTLDPGASDLRTWLRKSFFDDHIKRYSKSRRKAPIYWRLGTRSGSYSVWVYYHRFTRDTLHRVLHDFAVPKLQHEERRLTELTQDGGPSPTASQRKAIAAQDAFVAELRTFRDELRRVAPLWNPDLDDGVILNFAPLWRLVGHTTSWQKECRQAWDKLAAGEYDWAHLAMHLWPERVVPRCADDRSFAIAHGLEDVFWVERDGKWEPRSVTEDQVARLVAERSSKAVEAARDDLLRAPAPTGSGRGRRRSS